MALNAKMSNNWEEVDLKQFLFELDREDVETAVKIEYYNKFGKITKKIKYYKKAN